ncbi:MAG TPA: hypothetical protein VNF92_05805 [Gemmatimonadaceae bacterium]|nr:hypothetical protein [Gemmatimonadaceae bacterium]
MPDPVVGIAWYTESEWQVFRAKVADPERLEATYAEWVEVAEAALEDFRRLGLKPQRVPIRAAEFFSWCKEESRLPDSEARASYVSEVLARADEA